MSKTGSPEVGAAFLRFLANTADNDDSGDSLFETFDRMALGECGVHAIQARDGYMQCRCTVGPKTRNGFSTMHGGCIATLIDVVSSAALVTVWGSPGVSVSMDIHYISPGMAGSVLEVRARVVHAGQRLATMTVDIVDIENEDRVVSHGTHVKCYSKNDNTFHTATKDPQPCMISKF